jgi:hypothetical protein
MLRRSTIERRNVSRWSRIQIYQVIEIIRKMSHLNKADFITIYHKKSRIKVDQFKIFKFLLANNVQEGFLKSYYLIDRRRVHAKMKDTFTQD